MSDLISRQAAIDALARMMPHSYTPDGSHPADEEIFRAQEVFADCIEALEILPSAQPEIIRCKGCKHQVKEWRTDKRLKDKGYMVCGCEVVGDACGYWALLGQDDDYCNMAERRTDEE